MAVNIGPKIGIDGMPGYRKQMDLIIQQSKELAAEMKAVTSEYDKNDKSQEKLTRQSEVLAKQIENQKNRISLLEKGYSRASDELSKLAADLYDATQAYGENSKEVEKLQSAYTKQSKTVSKYQTDINNATAVLNGMEKELDDVGSAMDGATSDAGDLSDAIEDVADSAKSSGGGFTIMKGTIADLASSGIQAGISVVTDFAKSIVDLAEETREYRSMQAKMSGSAEAFGYSMDFASEKYQEFYSYLADDQMSTNAITNLMGLQVETQTLSNLAEASIGVWTAYGDSIPIESLTESINETAQVAQVTGVLADALNWAGISEDDFNTKLQSLNTTQERADLIASTLNDTYGESKATYDEMTGSIREANEAEAELKDAQAELGEAVEPLDTAFKKLQTGALSLITPLVKGLGDALSSLDGNVNEYRQDIYDAIATTEELQDALKTSVDELSASTEALQDTMDEMENGSSTTNTLVKALDDLEKKSGKTADEQYRMEAIVTQLNSLFPDLGLEIDDTTGKLNKSTDAISDYVKEAENTELAVEAQGEAATAADKLAEAEARRAEAAQAAADVTAKVILQEDKIQEILDAQNQKSQEAAETQRAYNDALETGSGNLDQLYMAMSSTGEAMIEYEGQMMTVSQAYEIANQELIDLKAAEQEHQEQLAAQDAIVEQAKTTLDEYNTALGNSATNTDNANLSNTAYQEGMQANITKAGEAEEAFNNMSTSQQNLALELEESVTAMQENMKNTITSQMDMFSKFDHSIDLSTQDLLANMRSQVAGVENWEQNISSLSDKGINKNLLQYLMNMGPEGAGYVEVFSGMTTDELEEANELWEQAIDIQEMTNSWGQELTELGAQSIADGMDGVDAAIKASGADSVMGLVEGIRSAKSEAEAEGRELGQAVVDSTDEGAGVSSPSWKTKQTGQYIDSGLTQGLTAGKSAVMTAARNIGNELIRSINTAAGTSGGASTRTKTTGRQAGLGVSAGLTASMSSVRTAARNVGRTAVSQINASLSKSTLRVYGYNASIAMANGILSGRSAVISAAASVASAAISAAQSRLQIHSPSRVFLGMGENSVDAFARGFEAEKSDMINRVGKTLDFSAENAAIEKRFSVDYSSMTDALKKGIGSMGGQTGPISINVYAAEGQSEREIADAVIERLQHLVNQREAVFGT